jgi:predicted unusual protein kinase regulating ubiquinone biosynthesis (AarF/ABC1/UbiB family)
MADRPGSDQPPSGRARRSAQLAAVVARSAGDRLVTELRARRGDDEAAQRFHERNAQRYTEYLGRSKGVLMKAGQALSFASYGSAVPTEYAGIYQAALSRLRADAPPMDPETARAVIEVELGAPVERLFATFDDRPLAAASIGQVHRATLPDAEGTAVAVKVQYPGAADAINADLANTELLATFLMLGRPLFPTVGRVQVRSVAAELSERISEELDYTLEAGNLAFFGDAYRGHPFVRIPAVHPGLSTRRVLTMDLVEGRPWEEALAAPAELRDTWGEIVYRFAFGSMRRLHRINADPHPANYLFHDDGTVTFVDFGCVKRFRADTVAHLVGAMRALIDRDAAAVLGKLVALGYLPPEHDGPSAEELLDYLRALVGPVTVPQPFTFGPEGVAEVSNAKLDRRSPGRQFDLPRDVVFLERTDTGTMAILGQLRATADWRAILDELDGLGPPATDLGRAERAYLAEIVRSPPLGRGALR